MSERQSPPTPPAADSEGAHEAILHELATKFLIRLSALEQASKLYELNNAVVVKLFDDFVDIVQEFACVSGEPLQLSLQGFSFFVNRRLVHMDYVSYRKAEAVKRLWNRVGMGGMVLPEDVTVSGLQAFARRWIDAVTDPAAQATLFAQDWGGISVRRAESDDELGPRVKAEAYLVRTYCTLIVLMRDTIVRFQSHRRLPVLRLKRTLQVLIDYFEGHQGLWLALAQKPEFRQDLAAHAVGTAVLSMILASRAGVDRRRLVSLGIAALFHDLPKAGLNDRTLNSIENPEGMATEDRERLTKHWLAHLREFLTLGGLKAETLARVVTLHESQLEFSAEQLYDGEISSLSLFSELICWIDRFDTLTWMRPEKLPITEHEAQRAILARARGDYDPILRLFVKTFGVYPTGSAVRLLSGEIAIVIDQGGGSDPLRPIVKVIADRRGRAIDGPKADLSTQPKYGIHSSVLMSQLDVNAVALFSRKLGTSSKSL